jgi:hypothetical protein
VQQGVPSPPLDLRGGPPPHPLFFQVGVIPLPICLCGWGVPSSHFYFIRLRAGRSRGWGVMPSYAHERGLPPPPTGHPHGGSMRIKPLLPSEGPARRPSDSLQSMEGGGITFIKCFSALFPRFISPHEQKLIEDWTILGSALPCIVRTGDLMKIRSFGKIRL